MTCVVGLVDEDGKVWMGADSATAWDAAHCKVQITRNAKVFRVGALLLGSNGSGRVQNLLRSLVVPKHPRGVPTFEYIAIHVASAIRKTMQAEGVLIPAQGGNPEVLPAESTVLIGYKGGLYRMDEDFSVDEPSDEVEAIGSGGTWALPVLNITLGRPAKERVLAALKQSEKNCWSVRRPFRIEVI